MATPEHEAYYEGIPTNPTYSVIKGSVPYVCVVMKVTEGPLAGHEFKFEKDKWDTKSNHFAFRNMRGVGWQGKAIESFVSDVKAFAATGKTVRFQARLAEFNGARWWTAEKIGVGTTLIKQGSAPTADTDAMMNEMIADAARADEEYRASRGYGGGNGATPSNGGGDVEQRAGDACLDCKSPLFKGKDDYLTCKNGHDVIPF